MPWCNIRRISLFENPNAPRSLGPQPKAPNISIQVNVNAPAQIAEADYEVELLLEGAAGEDNETLFKFELNYAGIFACSTFRKATCSRSS